MDVTVYKQEFIFPIPQGSASTLFDITGNYSNLVWIELFNEIYFIIMQVRITFNQYIYFYVIIYYYGEFLKINF